MSSPRTVDALLADAAAFTYAPDLDDEEEWAFPGPTALETADAAQRPAAGGDFPSIRPSSALGPASLHPAGGRPGLSRRGEAARELRTLRPSAAPAPTRPSAG